VANDIGKWQSPQPEISKSLLPVSSSATVAAKPSARRWDILICVIKAKTFRLLGVFALLVFLPTACADGSSPEGFCRRWKILTDRMQELGPVDKDAVVAVLRSDWLGDSYKPIGNLAEKIENGHEKYAQDAWAQISKDCVEYESK